jgi:hypothetical protein
MTRTDRTWRQPPRTRYRSLTRFYAADPSRMHSRERDVGLWWRDDAAGPLHRAAWVNDTGELYLVRLGPAEEGGGEVEVLARFEDGERLEIALEGWRERCGAPRSLTWLRERARPMRAHAAFSSPVRARSLPSRRAASATRSARIPPSSRVWSGSASVPSPLKA